MMNYVMSDVHGDYEKYQKMLELIGLSDSDTLYLGGDLCDRGRDSAKLYLDVMERKNVVMIKGNHEELLLEQFTYLEEAYPEQNVGFFDLFYDRHLWIWFHNGGDATLLSMLEQSKKDQRRILDFIEALPYYVTVEVNGIQYTLVHGGLGDFTDGTALEEVSCKDMLWTRPDFDRRYFRQENRRLIVGHTPTFLIRNDGKHATVYHGKGDVIAIDCGAVFPEYRGRLGCLCLETGEEFYV